MVMVGRSIASTGKRPQERVSIASGLEGCPDTLASMLSQPRDERTVGREVPSQGPSIPSFIRRLMPAASEEELFAATDRMRQYLAIVMRIHERLERERVERDSRESVEDDRFVA